MEKEKRTEEAIQVFRKMLVEEFGIKSGYSVNVPKK